MRHIALRMELFLASVLLVGLAPLIAKPQATLPAGTEIHVRMDQQLDTGEVKAGQTFTGTVAKPVVVNGKTVLAKGTKVNGRVAEAVSSGRLKRPASITLQMTSPYAAGIKLDGKSHLVRNVALIGGGAAAGALLGGITEGKKGAAVGAAVGAGTGTAVAFITGKDEIQIPAEAVVPFTVGSGGAAPVGGTTTTQAYRGGGGGGEAAAATAATAGAAAGVLIFSDRDQQIIRSFVRQGHGLPPGLAKRDRLPPGLERQVRRNGTLPPGLQKKVDPFPFALERQLAPIPSGYSRVFLAGRALILDRNHRILDLMAVVN
jgi:hypothetical protein